MLADQTPLPASGAFAEDVQLHATARYEILDFIAEELPRWRDCPERPKETSESVLTDQLCSYLNGASRRKAGLDYLQFRTEVSDEHHKGRKVDLAPKPAGNAVWIEGRRHTQFETLLPIECKRLPTPKEKDRDEREYVFTKNSTTGGIQRFKSGLHGGSHILAGMIGYIQAGADEDWQKQISKWIKDLSKSDKAEWSTTDDLVVTKRDASNRLSRYRSVHPRNGLANIELQHLWITMNS